ncbi:hypothetical protein EDEG_02603 [Edhazardia aedis USNM 41457]|uniref:Uncharacterized protein n=1 Tax=Edhazardia aedis (strain USNM 41457) TaxID=1003232 RepID=J9D5E8_EDHAE|nr:hypothetical protein EDEG_02603 [Edhazardia aedis USNM 41457]|eukprot:EJW03021.1 hypothetical protein EDEG_02603 [Edhazardia aedis USNM 41457]
MDNLENTLYEKDTDAASSIVTDPTNMPQMNVFDDRRFQLLMDLTSKSGVNNMPKNKSSFGSECLPPYFPSPANRSTEFSLMDNSNINKYASRPLAPIYNIQNNQKSDIANMQSIASELVSVNGHNNQTCAITSDASVHFKKYDHDSALRIYCTENTSLSDSGKGYSSGTTQSENISDEKNDSLIKYHAMWTQREPNNQQIKNSTSNTLDRTHKKYFLNNPAREKITCSSPRSSIENDYYQEKNFNKEDTILLLDSGISSPCEANKFCTIKSVKNSQSVKLHCHEAPERRATDVENVMSMYAINQQSNSKNFKKHENRWFREYEIRCLNALSKYMLLIDSKKKVKLFIDLTLLVLVLVSFSMSILTVLFYSNSDQEKLAFYFVTGLSIFLSLFNIILPISCYLVESPSLRLIVRVTLLIVQLYAIGSHGTFLIQNKEEFRNNMHNFLENMKTNFDSNTI